MGSSNKKKKEKHKDFQKPKFKVGKAKAKASSFTDTSFKSKAISMAHQSISKDAPDSDQQFKTNLALATSSKPGKQRSEALAHLTNQLSADSPINPVGTSGLLCKLLPLVSDSSASVRAQLVKLFRLLPDDEVKHNTERIVMYVRAGMTNLSIDIRNDSLEVLDWLIDVAGAELISCAGGWVKTLKSFCASMGWTSVSSKDGWTSAPPTAMNPKEAQVLARQLLVLSKFLETGFVEGGGGKVEHSLYQRYYDALFRIPKERNPFAHLNPRNEPPDEDSEKYVERASRQEILHRRFLDNMKIKTKQAKERGGVAGRAATKLEQVLRDGMMKYEPCTLVNRQYLLDLW